MKTVFKFLLIAFLFLVNANSLHSDPIRQVPTSDDYQSYRMNVLRGTKGTFNSVPRLENGRADLETLLYELKDLNVNTYFWLIWHSYYDWDDLKLFLPIAKENNIKVWVGVVPPSESKPIFDMNSEPFGMDYLRWAKEIATLSVQYDNLVAWSIDDFYGVNLETFTLEYMENMILESHFINPKLAFLPCIYYNRAKVPNFASNYDQFFDGILFAYKAESSGEHNLVDTHYFPSEIAELRTLFRENIPFVVDIYSRRHSRAGNSSPAYVRDMIELGKIHADGIMIYTHPDKSRVTEPEKYEVIKRGFGGTPKDYPETSYTLSNDGLTLTKWLGTEAFVYMNEDTKLRLVTNIGVDAFNRASPQWVEIGDNVKTIAHRAFFYAQKLIEITVPENNNSFRSIDGVLYTKDGKTLHTYPYAKSIIVDNLPNNIETIGMTAFRNITPLTSVVLPESITLIDEASFANNTNLKKVQLGKNVNLIKGAFFSSTNIAEIKCNNPNPPKLEGNAFGHPSNVEIDAAFYTNCVLFVPSGSKGLYSNFETGGNWSKFKNIKEFIPAGLTLNTKPEDVFSINRLHRNTFSIKNLTSSTHIIDIFSINGQLCTNILLSENEATEFSLPNGLYIIKAENDIKKMLIY